MLFDRVRVSEVLVDLLAHVIGRKLPQRRVHRAVKQGRQAIRHRPFLLLDHPCRKHRLVVPGAIGQPRQQVVGRHFHSLVGVGMHHQLARGVGLKAGEERHPDAAHLPGEVLLRHRRPGAGHQPILDVGPMPLGLPHVLGECRLQLGITGHLARPLDLLERL